MRLIEVANFGTPRAGSFIPTLVRLLSVARDRGWRSEAVFGASAEDQPWLRLFADADLPVRIAPPLPRRRLTGWFECVLGEDREPTVLHSHFSELDLPVLRVARRRPGVAVIWHAHTPLSRRPPVVARNIVRFGALGRSVDLVLTPGLDMVGAIRRRGAPRRRVRHFYNAIDVDRYPLQGPLERATSRRDLGLSPDETMLLHFGWDWRRKGGDLFLRAVKELSRSGSRVVGVSITEAEEAEALRSRLGLTQSVRLVPMREDTLPLFAAADITVAVSRQEGSPYAIMESLAAGTPVVASDIPGQRLIAEGLDPCRLVPLEPAEIAGAILELRDRPEGEAARDRIDGRRRIERDFGLDGWCERMLDVYEEVLSARTDRAIRRFPTRRVARRLRSRRR